MMAPVLTKHCTKEDAKKKAMELLEKVGMADKADVYPRTLSLYSKSTEHWKSICFQCSVCI